MIPFSFLGPTPPVGRGIYARALPLEVLARFDFVALDYRRGDTPGKVRSLGARKCWLYATPEAFQPGAWQRSVDAMDALCRSLGCAGIIIDREPHGNADNADAQDLARKCVMLAREYRVIVTSYPEWSELEAFAEIAKGRVIGSAQYYHNDWYARFHQRWHNAFGSRHCNASIAYWVPDGDPSLRDPTRYLSYVNGFPAGMSTIGWPTSTPPQYMLDATLSVGQRARALVLGSARAWLAWASSLPGAIILVLLALLLALVLGLLL